MNKKEIAEIKKQFKMDNERMVINKVATYCVDRKGEITYKSIRNFSDTTTPDMEGYMPAKDSEICMDFFKKTLGGTLGKSLMEFEFPCTADNPNEKRDNLYALLKTELTDEEKVDEYISEFIEKYNEPSAYTIFLAHCTYDIPSKDKNGEKEDVAENEYLYDFLILSVCPLEREAEVLYYNNEAEILQNKDNISKIAKPPVIGYLFPTFNNREPDVNTVLCFFKNAKEPNTRLVEDILGCAFTMSANEELVKFNTLLMKTAGVKASGTANDTVSYNITEQINTAVNDILVKGSIQSEPTTLDKEDIKRIFLDSGVSEEQMKDFDEDYDNIVGDEVELNATNIINPSKMDIKSPDVVINVKQGKTSKVSPRVIDGKRCLVIELDEDVQINGLQVNIDDRG